MAGETIVASTIMVVDDVVENLNLLDVVLRNAGFEVRLAPNGPLALRSLVDNVPDLVLMDVEMPGIDGLQVCRSIREELKLVDLPVIFMSGIDDDERRSAVAAAGGTDLVGKPFNLKSLVALIERYLTQSQTAADFDSAGTEGIQDQS